MIRIRKKGKYFVIEKLESGKVEKSLTLNPEKTWEMLTCQPEKVPKVSEKSVKIEEKQDQKFSQDILAEPIANPENLTLVEEMRRKQNEMLSGNNQKLKGGQV